MTSRRGPLARLNIPAGAAILAAALALPAASAGASTRHVRIPEAKRHAAERIKQGGRRSRNAVGVAARVRTGRRPARRRPTRR